MKKTIALASIIAILFSVFAFVGTNVYGFAATSISGTNSITITRKINDVTNPVSNTFTYKIKLVSKPTSPVVGTVGGSILPNETTDETKTINVVFDNKTPNNKVATSTATLNLSTVTFDELGDYVFEITESDSADSTTYPVDTTNKYQFCITVRNELNGTTPTGNLVATLINPTDKDNHKLSDYNLNYESTSQHTYIELTKNVTGDGARLDSYFKFEITFDDDRINVGDKIIVANTETGSNYYTTTSQYSEETVDANKKITVYLKHGQTITIGKTADGTNQLPINANYKIKEIEDSTKHETYTTTVNGVTTTEINKTTVDVDNDNFNSNNKTTFINNKTLEPVTGIFINVMPFVALIALAFVGIMVIKKTSKKEDE